MNIIVFIIHIFHGNTFFSTISWMGMKHVNEKVREWHYFVSPYVDFYIYELRP